MFMKCTTIHLTLFIALLLTLGACNNEDTKVRNPRPNDLRGTDTTDIVTYDSTFQIEGESFADLQLLRYQVPGFKDLSIPQKQLAYYLYEAALCGRDMIYDQKSKYGLMLRKTLEAAYSSFHGDTTSEDWKSFREYCGRVWFSNGNHHHYSNEKFIPACSFNYFASLVKRCDTTLLPKDSAENVLAFINRLKPVVYDLKVEPKVVDLRANIDNIAASSVNFYEGVSQKEVEGFYAQADVKGNAPSWGLNSKLLKQDGRLIEKVWKVGSMYSPAIEKIVGWLQKASDVAENAEQKSALLLLIQFYKTGDLASFDDYNIAWVKDVNSRLDAVNGFIEVYLDPIGKKGSYESVVSMKDMEATKKIKAIADQAQWFEDNSPLMPEHKKKNVKGITGKAITVIAEAGDAAPGTPIGINLPNSEWIRKEHGSKSVSLTNIIYSYNVAGEKSGLTEEFALNDTIKQRLKQYGNLASDLLVDMHECIGHASGQLNPGVQTTDKTLKNYASTLEEARADLVGLYFIMDKKLIDIGVSPSIEVGNAEYDSYMMNALLTQLTRLKPGDHLEEAHMRNRQMNARWVFEKGKKDKVVELIKANGKTYVRINDYNKLRELFGQLLKEIQRIKSEGDFNAGKALVETYGVKVDPALLKEILVRYKKLGVKPYRGFIQPRLVPIREGDLITDVKIEYPNSFFDQMIEYGKKYALLPVKN